MANIEEFKSFVKKHPSLLKKVELGEMTWQKYYELYDLYGETSEIWNPYFENELSTNHNFSTGNFVNDFFSYFQNIDLNRVQKGIGNLQKVLSSLKDTEKKEEPYKPRPIYKHFED